MFNGFALFAQDSCSSYGLSVDGVLSISAVAVTSAQPLSFNAH